MHQPKGHCILDTQNLDAEIAKKVCFWDKPIQLDVDVDIVKNGCYWDKSCAPSMNCQQQQQS
jgi:hypothetical protein